MRDPAHWMGCLVRADPKFGILPISGLAIPGSDNAGAYNLDALAFDTQPGSGCSLFVKGENALGATFERWSTTQDETITQQLDQGIRFIDLQIAYNGAGSWRVAQNVFSEYPLAAYLDQVAQWAKTHPSEVVIVDLRRICYDNGADAAADAGLWSSFVSKSSYPGAVSTTTLAHVAFDDSSVPGGSFATATLDDIVQQGGGGHNVVVVVPSSASDLSGLGALGVHPVIGVAGGAAAATGAIPVAEANPGAAPLTAASFVSSNGRVAQYPLGASPALGALVGRGLYVSWLTYSLDATALHDRLALFGRFGGLIEPYLPAHAKQSSALPAWESGLYQGAQDRADILASWGHRTNVVVSDGIEYDGFVSDVVALNAK